MGGNRSTEEKEEAPFPLTDTDKWVLSQTDEEFQLHNWDELKEIIGKIYSSGFRTSFPSLLSARLMRGSSYGSKHVTSPILTRGVADAKRFPPQTSLTLSKQETNSKS